MSKIINVDKARDAIDNYRRDAFYKRDKEKCLAEKYCDGYQDALDKAEAILTRREFESGGENKFEAQISVSETENKIFVTNQAGEKCEVTKEALKAVFEWFMISGSTSISYDGVPYSLTLTDDLKGGGK